MNVDGEGKSCIIRNEIESVKQKYFSNSHHLLPPLASLLGKQTTWKAN
jgi:hypothetical protein